MRMDTNTNGHRQWFYFSVRNILPGVVKFNVYRFKKKFSLFQRGMKPYIRSLKAKQNWKPGGTKVSYICEKQPNEYGVVKEKMSYFLSFQYRFIHPEDQVFFSSGLPYTATFMKSRLDQFSAAQLINGVTCKVSSLGKSMCGQQLPLLTIENSQGPENKNFIVINTRTHAGQTSCSWVLDGLLERIIGSQDAQQWIKQNNISLKILPMLNIDGVFMGNYRTGIMGEDFNRKFASGRKQIFPQLFALKKLVSQCKKIGKLFMFLDLHGHSILKNSFIYGPIESLFQKNPCKKIFLFLVRTLPFNLWHSSKYFRLSSCKFRFQKDLTETARVYFQIRDAILTYTCQISLGLYYQNGKTIQFLENDYKLFGASIADTFVQLLTKEKIKNYEPSREEGIKMIPTQVENCSLQKNMSKKKDAPTNKLPSFKKQKQMYFQKIKKARNEINQQFKGKLKNNGEQNQLHSSERQRESKLERIQNKKLINHQNGKQSSEKLMEPRAKKYSFGYDVKTTKNSTMKNRSQLPLNDSLRSTKVPIKGETSPQGCKKGIFYGQELSSKIIENKIGYRNKNQLHKSLKKSSGHEQSERSSEFSLHDSGKHEVEFKIRRKSDILKVLPESLRKKVITKGMQGNLNSTAKYFASKHQEEEEEAPFVFERSVTYDPSYDKNFDNELITEPNQLQKIDQNFSDDYSSMNDSDASSEDLCEKEKQYLLQCIRNNRKLHTYNDDNEDQQKYEDQTEQMSQNLQTNINGFKEIRFKSIEPVSKIQSPIHPNLRPTKREPHKFRDITHKSLCRNYFQEQNAGGPPNIAQRKHLNQRIQRKTQREPYFLIQIKSKNN